MAINSRAKGCRGERLVIELIRPWWQQLEPEAEFARTPGSGGWQGRGSRGQSLRGETRMGGDLMTTSARFPFSVEVKNYGSWTMLRLAQGKSSLVWDWWRQCQTAAAEARLVPMLWFRHLREPWKVLLPFDYAARLAIQPPIIVWTRMQLAGVQYGASLPILFEASTVLRVDPARLAL